MIKTRVVIVDHWPHIATNVGAEPRTRRSPAKISFQKDREYQLLLTVTLFALLCQSGRGVVVGGGGRGIVTFCMPSPIDQNRPRAGGTQPCSGRSDLFWGGGGTACVIRALGVRPRGVLWKADTALATFFGPGRLRGCRETFAGFRLAHCLQVRSLPRTPCFEIAVHVVVLPRMFMSRFLFSFFRFSCFLNRDFFASLCSCTRDCTNRLVRNFCQSIRSTNGRFSCTKNRMLQRP